LFRVWWYGLGFGEGRLEMYRPGRNNEICFESLEEAVAGRSETFGHPNLICFGFPCQDISTANSEAKGIQGERSSIFFECMRIVDLFKPAWLLIENVPRLLSINGGRDFAVVLQTLSKSGYGYAWRVLDSQYFGLAQRRKRVFIVGRLGGIPAPEILFEQKSGGGVDKKKRKVGKGRICVSSPLCTRGKHSPATDTFIASPIKATDDGIQIGGDGNEGNLVAKTITASRRGDTSFVWQDTYIAETNSYRKGKITRISRELDSCRGIVIGNAVSVPVAEWIGRRIIKYG
jgi:DNA (cytosine-5)-methyltransferase 1